METISRDETRELIGLNDGITVVEVLDEENYQEFHLPGAINVPLGENFAENIQRAVPDKHRTVLLYCLDAECQASPKAAARMAELGYTNVLAYEAGKVDWKEAGLPVER
jgi:rhodanese-related sulfurtransferase